jgi:hypothetical protein
MLSGPIGRKSSLVVIWEPEASDIDAVDMVTSERGQSYHHMGDDRPEMFLEHVLDAVATDG